MNHVLRLRTRLRSRHNADDGVALVIVIAFGFMTLLLTTIALGQATSNLPGARLHQDSSAALSAAEAAIDDMLFRLDRNPAYYTTIDQNNVALHDWAPVAGGVGAGARYHYAVDSTNAAVTGEVVITATGVVNGVTRTLSASMRRRGFLDHAYMTEFEAISPLTWFTPATEDFDFYTHYCSRHRDDQWTDNATFYAGDDAFGPIGSHTGRLTAAQAIAEYQSNGQDYITALYRVYGNVRYCPEIIFNDGDVLVGPLHSNDGIAMNGSTPGLPRFLGPVTTAYKLGETITAATDLWINYNGTTEPYFQGGIAQIPDLTLPPANTEIEGYAVAGGCRYEGPTYIHLTSTGGGGRMTVNSPLTPANANACGTGVNLPLPANGVIYVDESNASCSAHPLEMDLIGNITTYSCRAGDAFVWGELDGQITIAANDDIRIVADMTYAGGLINGDDVLGLVANDTTWVHHPVDAAGAPIDVVGNPPFVTTSFTDPIVPSFPNGATTWNDPVIHAAIVSLRNSFSVENHHTGGDGNAGSFDGDVYDLTVRGAIAQRFRGPVGTSSSSGRLTGYDKDYAHDARLFTMSPPFFIEPLQAAWNARAFAQTDDPQRCTGNETPAHDGCLPTNNPPKGAQPTPDPTPTDPSGGAPDWCSGTAPLSADEQAVCDGY